eukprot:CAMPEP_0181213880 /NCGR_PEP_ID=MMETSP1096-20121128/25146_1 /TAXON_ID=156174 ORGANISM="Chrysochromulina ericina, Strain CCMP281" /NCGR_SAMPLE_ID=MMETSP1096 /ASSEMBLY_ACC=CAM_ASM_000453 /LENGTH=41 /DNA_ID= /DNA_START= /DNA_END= /DNA_ORIENTATION=
MIKIKVTREVVVLGRVYSMCGAAGGGLLVEAGKSCRGRVGK